MRARRWLSTFWRKRAAHAEAAPREAARDARDAHDGVPWWNPHWIARGWLGLFRRSRVEREMDEEMRFHLECRAEELRRTLGVSAEEARRRAALEFGGVESYKEQGRHAFGMRMVEDLWRDLAYASRSLRRTPGFTLTATAAIALGVAVNIALFAIVYAVMLRPLPIADPAGARNVYLEARGEGRRSTYGTHYVVSFAELGEMRSRSRTTDLAGVAEARVACPCRPGANLRTQLVSDNLLPLIGAQPVLGRFFTAAETSTIGSAPVIVLAHTAWQQIFGADPHIVGRGVMLNRTMFTVIGVADASATGPLLTKPDLWMPLTMQDVTRPGDAIIAEPTTAWIQLLARLRPGVSDGEVQAELALLGQQAVARHSPLRTTIVTVLPAAFLNYPDVARQGAVILGLLFAAVALVLLIGCMNVANMLLARGLTRRREVAIRLAIGAGRRRLIQQFLVESVLLGLIGGALGLALSQIAARVVVASLPAEAMAHRLDVSPDWTILGYTMLLSLVASLLFGGLPALRLLRQDVTPALKTDAWHAAPGGRGRRGPSLQALLVAGQAAVTLMLLVDAGLLLRGFDRALQMDRGQRGRDLLIAGMDLNQQRYTVDQAIALVDALRARAREAPGVSSVSLTTQEPLTSFSRTRLRWEGTPAAQGMTVSADEVGLDYFATMRIALQRGRVFEAADLREGASALIVDEPLARALAASNGGQDVLGRAVLIGDRRHDIVGIVAATRGLHPAGDNLPRIFRPIQGRGYLWARLVLHYDGPREPIVAALRQAMKELDPEAPLTIKPIEENVQAVMAPIRIIASVVSGLGLLGLVLGCTGLYGVVAFSVGRRRRELGIRLTLGATRAQVLRLVIGQGLLPVLAGGAAGLLLAAASSHLLRAALYGLSPFDPIAFATMALILGAAATLAALLPARAALTVDPSETLRHE